MDEQLLFDKLAEVADRLSGIERAVRANTPKAGFSVCDVAFRLNMAEWTIRDWCRTGRIQARKNLQGEWVVSPEELARLEREGPLPLRQ